MRMTTEKKKSRSNGIFSSLEQQMRPEETHLGPGLKNGRGNNMEEEEVWRSSHLLVGTELAKFK